MDSKQPPRRDAFKEVFENHYQQLHRFAAMKVKDEDQADMIVVDVFLKVYIKRPEINPKFGISPLLYTMVENASIDFLRRRKVEERRFKEYVLYQRRGIHYVSPESDFWEGERSMEIDSLMRDIEELPIKSREALTGYYFEAIPLKVLAVRRGVSESSIRNLIAFARRQLKRRIEGR